MRLRNERSGVSSSREEPPGSCPRGRGPRRTRGRPWSWARSTAKIVQDNDLLELGAVRERRVQREADHLLGRLLLVATRLGAERDATARVVRGANGALTGAAGALLAEGLLAATANLFAGLGGLGARTLGGELGLDDLVHHGHVGLDTEDGGLEGHGTEHRAGNRLALHAVLDVGTRSFLTGPRRVKTSLTGYLQPSSDSSRWCAARPRRRGDRVRHP